MFAYPVSASSFHAASSNARSKALPRRRDGLLLAVPGTRDAAFPRLHEQTLAGCVRVLGQDHPSTLVSRGELAAAYQSAGDLGRRSIPLHEQALAGCVRVLGQDHRTTLAARNNLAAAYLAAGDLGRAIPVYEQALADHERVLGQEHLNTKIVRGNLAAARRKHTAGGLG